MVIQILISFLAGAFGGAFGEILHIKKERASILRSVVVILISGALTALYFSLVERTPITSVGQIVTSKTLTLFLNYGIFAALFIEEIVRPEQSSSSGTPSTSATAGFVFIEAVLVLDGFWQVFGAGVFGGFVAEVALFYKQRTKRFSYPPSYWIITSLMLLCGGLLTVFHGTHNISALLAAQIGASAPLIGTQLRRAPQRSGR